jgi:hypothetical protein
MKRIIIGSFLVLALAGSAFAQLSLSGDAYVGFEMLKNFDADETLTPTHRKEGAPLFNLAAIATRENYGAKLDVSFQSDNPFTLNGVYGWVGFMDNNLKFTMGMISDPVWVVAVDPDYEKYYDEVTGFRVEYATPLEGLSVGLAFSAENFTFKKFFEKVVMGANYINPMFNAVVAYDVGSNGNLLFGFDYTGIDDLTAGLQMEATELATFGADIYGGSIGLIEKVGYRVMRPLNVSLLMGQLFYGSPENDKPELFFFPSASYRILPNLTGSLTLGLETNDLFETNVYSIKPCIEFTLKGPAIFYVEYEVRIGEEKSDSSHRFGFGMDIKAF